MEIHNPTNLPLPKNIGKIKKHKPILDDEEFNREKLPLAALKNQDILNKTHEMVCIETTPI